MSMHQFAILTFMQKVVLITGCSSGFGYAAALKFAENGYMTYASVRNLRSEGAKQLQKVTEEKNLPLEVIEIDVRSDTSITKNITHIIHKRNTIDILVNNAGYGYLGPIEETPIKEIQDLYQTNIFGVIRMIQAVVPIMRKHSSGLIINLSSINGIVPFPLFSIYSTTKFAIETLTEGLRFELKHFGINVAAVEPGSYLTRFSINRKQPKHILRLSSPYKILIDNFFHRYQQTHTTQGKHLVSKTANAQEVADVIFKIAQTPKPSARYRVGLDAHKYYYLRKFLPFFLWEWTLHKIYKW